MRGSKRPEPISKIKSLSPKQESKFSKAKPTKLPQISETKKQAARFFFSPEPQLLFRETGFRKTAVPEISPFKIDSPRASDGSLEQSVALKGSGTLSSLPEITNENEEYLNILKQEVMILQNQLAKSNQALANQKKLLGLLEESLKQESPVELSSLATTSAEDLSQSESESEQIFRVAEAINFLKNSIKSAEKIMKQQEKNCFFLQNSNNELNSLTGENSVLKTYAQELNKKVEKIKASKTKVKTQLEEVKNKMKEAEEESKENVECLRTEIKRRVSENLGLKEIISKKEDHEMVLMKSLNELESEMAQARSDQRRAEAEKDSFKHQIQSLLEKKDEFEKTAKLHKEVCEQLEESNEKINKLDLQHTKDVSLIIKLNKDIESINYLSNLNKHQWESKEKSYQNDIQELLERLEQERTNSKTRLNESLALNRALTSNDSNEDIGQYSKNEVRKYMNRILKSEDEIANYKIEVEKLTKSQEYYKGLVQSKNEAINKMQLMIDSLDKSGKNEESGIFGLLKKLKLEIVCKKCKGNSGVSLLMPCLHVLCSECRGGDEVCAVCERRCRFRTAEGHFEFIELLIQRFEEITN